MRRGQLRSVGMGAIKRRDEPNEAAVWTAACLADQYSGVVRWHQTGARIDDQDVYSAGVSVKGLSPEGSTEGGFWMKETRS